MWEPWGAWSACSQTCGGGMTSRRRACPLQNCGDEGLQSIECNLGSCAGIIIIKSVLGESGKTENKNGYKAKCL